MYTYRIIDHICVSEFPKNVKEKTLSYRLMANFILAETFKSIHEFMTIYYAYLIIRKKVQLICSLKIFIDTKLYHKINLRYMQMPFRFTEYWSKRTPENS